MRPRVNSGCAVVFGLLGLAAVLLTAFPLSWSGFAIVALAVPCGLAVRRYNVSIERER